MTFVQKLVTLVHKLVPTHVGSIKQSRDADGVNNYQQTGDGKLVTRGHPLCNYCGIPSHQRAVCRHRLRDVEHGIKRNTHPARGTLPSGNQMRKEAQSRIVAAADQWNNPLPTTPTPTPQGQMTQWAGHGNTPTPMTVIVTNPEDQKWLTQAI